MTSPRQRHGPGRLDLAKRVLVGQKLRSAQLGETLLPKRIALPVFASDPLSSVAYSPDEIFLTLSLAGVAAYTYSWKIGMAIAFVMVVVVLSYRQNVQAYKSGGGDYEVATRNLGGGAGLTVASALLVDYVLTVAVSIASASQYAVTTVGALRGHQVAVAVVAVLFLMAMNLRGVRESGKAFAVPKPVYGREKVARLLVGGAAAGERLGVTDIRFADINGQPGALLLNVDGAPVAVVSLDIADDLVQTVHAVSNPEKLRHLRQDRDGVDDD